MTAAAMAVLAVGVVLTPFIHHYAQQQLVESGDKKRSKNVKHYVGGAWFLAVLFAVMLASALTGDL